jgi:hypothetical protein
MFARGEQNRRGHREEHGSLKPTLRRSLLDHVKDLLTGVRDQRALVRELRRSITELRQEETARRAVRPPRDVDTAASRSR